MATGPKKIAAWVAAALLTQLGPAALAKKRPPRVRPAITAAGPGVIVGDWRLGVSVATGADPSNHSINAKERAPAPDHSAAEPHRTAAAPLREADPLDGFRRICHR